jgi:hypothetical protein
MMFQAAACIGYAKKHGIKWGCPVDTREVPHFLKMFPNVPVINGMHKPFNRTDPSQFNYEEIPKFERDTTLVGFFQSEKYFNGAHDEVSRVFNLNIKTNEKISIHVRRGDYASEPNNFPPVPISYIKQAISLFRTSGLGDYFVFSDDIGWCRSVFSTDIPNETFEFCEEGDEFRSLSLMASCSHHIIANSTFSWWAAWLNPNPNKIVVCPHHETWFGPDNGVKATPVDLIPSTWHQIRTR